MIYTIILGPEQWTDCWKEMCDTLGYVPAWCDYPDYFGCISCNLIKYRPHGHDTGLKIVFEEATDAMAFKLKYS